MTFGFCESVDPNLAEAPAPDQRKPPVIHTVLNAFTDLPVGIALCGFLITPHNRRSMASAIGEGARACKPCEIALLELHWALGEHGTEVDQ